MTDEEMRPLWHKESCWECGVEGQATRTEPSPKSKPYVCEACEMYQRGYDDAVKHRKKEAVSKEKSPVNEINLTYELKNPCCSLMNAAISNGQAELLSTEIGKQPPCIATRKPPHGGWHPWYFCPWCGMEFNPKEK